MKPDSFDILAFAGVCTVIIGVQMIYPPAAVILSGIYLIFAAVGGAAFKGKPGDKETK